MSDDWTEDIDDKSMEKALEADFPPTLNPQKNRTYEVEIISEPRHVDTIHGDAYVVDIIYEGRKRSLFLPKSFRFNLLRELKKANVGTNVNGCKVEFQKKLGKTKEYGDQMLYSVVLLDKK